MIHACESGLSSPTSIQPDKRFMTMGAASDDLPFERVRT
jgi:hypothetical protein